MDRAALLNQLSEKTFAYFQWMGLSPVKCRQLVAERMQTWKTLPPEKLQELLDSAEAP
jgi:hypothetical protein